MTQHNGLHVKEEYLFIKGLSFTEKALLSQIDHLSEKHGCFASKEWFCHRFTISPKTLKRYLDKLFEKGYISDTKLINGKRGLLVHRDIVHNSQNKDKLSTKNGQVVPKKWTSCPKQPSMKPIEAERKIKERYLKKDTPLTPLFVQNSEKKEEEEWVFFGSKVKLKKEAFQELCDLYGRDVINLIGIEMEDYVLSSRPQGYFDYAAAFRDWIRRRKLRPIEKPKSPVYEPTKVESQLQKDWKLIDLIYRNNRKVLIDKIVIDINSVRLPTISDQIYVMGEPNFYEQIREPLKTLGCKYI